MMDTTRSNEFFDRLATILLRSALIGFGMLAFWAAAIFLAGDLVYGVHARLFDLTFHELQVIHYCGMGLTKLIIFCCFLAPWLAIRSVVGWKKS